jgi:hypothetical protein
MTRIGTVLVKQPHIDQQHDNVDWIVEGLAKAKLRAERLGDDTLLELLNDIAADVAHLKGTLPARQLQLDL